MLSCSYLNLGITCNYVVFCSDINVKASFGHLEHFTLEL